MRLSPFFSLQELQNYLNGTLFETSYKAEAIAATGLGALSLGDEPQTDAYKIVDEFGDSFL